MMNYLLIALLFTANLFAVEFNKIDDKKSLELLLNNIHPSGTEKGVVVASPSKSQPNYFYHWVRDAALVMSTIFDVMVVEQDPIKKNQLKSLMYDFVARVQSNQQASGFFNLGEPKYHVDGRPFTGPWGRPQHDGPALRAVTLIKFANYLIDEGQEQWVRENLYTPELPALSPIKMDLEYTAIYFNSHGFDYWEEVMGLHFSTAMAQRRALLSGAKLARRLGDNGAADFYEIKAQKVSKLIETFWNPNKGHIESTLNQTRGVYKSQLDVSVILGVHHGDNGDGFFGVEDSRVMATAVKIEESFKQIYSINKSQDHLGTAIGRYPEDTYDGYRTDRLGNPWFLATFAMGEYYLRLEKRLRNSSSVNIQDVCHRLQLSGCDSKDKLLSKLRNKALGFFKRADYHADDNGHMDEQMSRFNGFMMGARDLTWSYAAHISAALQL
ncbi:MAG: glycoside hydrolase family 15 protein [Bacteriovoracaceae bacterium]|nr:glycoside hydrolase family 15 protein [Bacteriovoracaceae bacterium]